jgi:hypothetical protein
MGRPRSDNPMVHTAVVLPRDLLERLREDGEASNRGLSGEIRQRLQATYGHVGPALDPETSHLVEQIRLLADSLARDLGRKWHESKYALAAFKGGLLTLLASHASEGDEGTRDIPGHTDNPETVGRTHARLVLPRRDTEN